MPHIKAIHFHGAACGTCGGTLRYRKSRHCVPCNRAKGVTPKAKARNRAYYATSKAKAHKRAYEATSPIGLAMRMVANARTRAKNAGVPFALTPADIEARVRHGRCEATGIKFDLSSVGSGQSRRPFGPSIDRRVSSGGYVLGNIRVVCNVYNLAKSDFSEADVLRMAKALARFEKTKGVKPVGVAEAERLGPEGKAYVATATHKPDGEWKANY